MDRIGKIYRNKQLSKNILNDLSKIKMLKDIIRKTTPIVYFNQELKCRKLSDEYDIAGKYKRIYHYHIRKTGGTSLNHIILSLGNDDGAIVRGRINRTFNHRTISGNKVYVNWDKHLLKKGNYFYGWAHYPKHKVSLPENTFTVTCLRDPVKRIISHYNMLFDYRTNNINHSCMKIEGKWLGNSLQDFLSRIPKEYLLNQIYMFSREIDVDEAFENITSLSHYFFTEDFAGGINELSLKLNIELESRHDRKGKNSRIVSEDDTKLLNDIMRPEVELINRLKELRT